MKLKIFNHAKIKISNIDLGTIEGAQTISDSVQADFYLDSTTLFEGTGEIGRVETPISHISVLGAFAVLRNLGLPAAEIIREIMNFRPLEHRCEIVPAKSNSILFINDSKSTNLINSIYCLKKFSGEKVGWICGGKFTPQDLSVLAQIPKVHYIATIGASGQILYDYLEGKFMVGLFQALPEAVHACLAHDCTTIALSPGYPSLDQYANFNARGLHFKEVISQLS
jgi:UDP-N-acetylmuramoylalanine--D-glutamate ligase